MNLDHDENKDFEEWMAGLEHLPARVAGKRLEVPGKLDAVGPAPGVGRFCLRAAGILLLVCTALIAVLGIRGLRLMTFGQTAGFVAIGVILIAAATRWFHQEWTPGSRVLLSPLSTSTLIGIAGIGFLLVGFRLQPDWPHFLTSGAVCVSIGTASALVLASLLGRIAKHGFAVDQQRAAWAAGGLATIAGWIVLQIYCPKQEMAHLATWHGVALIVGAWSASVLTRKLTKGAGSVA